MGTEPSRKTIIVNKILLLLPALLLLFATADCAQKPNTEPPPNKTIDLPAPDKKGSITVEQTLMKRRSIRQFTQQKLTLKQIGQLLWAAQGITEPNRGFRTAPSAGALYPLELYLLTEEAIYHYLPRKHQLNTIKQGDHRPALAKAAWNQQWVEHNAAVIIIAADYSRTARRYREKAIRYVHMEVGCASENILLQAVALKLGSVLVGAFDDKKVKEILFLPEDQTPLLLIPIGYPK